MTKRLAIGVFVTFTLLLFVDVAKLQSNSETNSNQVNTDANQSNTSANSNAVNIPEKKDAKTSEDNQIKNHRDALKIVSEGSQGLNNWCLLIITASIAAIVSTSYLRPTNKIFRALYLLFIPGWILISLSIFYGVGISRRYMAAMLTPKLDVIREIIGKVSLEFDWQLSFLQWGLAIFAIWVLAFLLFWVFDEKLISNKTK